MPSKSIPSNHWKLNVFYNRTLNETSETIQGTYYTTSSKSCKVHGTQSLAAKACV